MRFSSQPSFHGRAPIKQEHFAYGNYYIKYGDLANSERGHKALSSSLSRSLSQKSMAQNQ